MIELTTLDLINGIFAILIVVSFYFIGLKLISKSIHYGNRSIFYMGASLPFLSNFWLVLSINFLYILFSGNSISPELYLTIGYGISLALIFWLALITELLYKKRQKIILGSFLVYWVIMEVLFFRYLFMDISALGTFSQPLTPILGPFVRIRSIISIIILTVTTLLFYLQSRKSTIAENKLKGTLLLLGIIFFLAGSIFFLITSINFIPMFLFIPSLVCIYGALILPNWMRNLFLKKE